jgi:tyrosine-protein phosphatase SIW14
MARRWQVILGLTVAGIVGTAPLVYSAYHNFHLRNLRVVEEGVLYRSGQLTPLGLETVVRERGIKTVITLRAARIPGEANPDAWEEAFCAARGLNHVRIPPRLWSANENGEIPAEQGVYRFLQVMDDPANHPVLVHCFAGIHRTGTMCAIFRIEYHRWSAERAINEMELYGFDPADMQEYIEGYLRSYTPRWKAPKR